MFFEVPVAIGETLTTELFTRYTSGVHPVHLSSVIESLLIKSSVLSNFVDGGLYDFN